jgi:4,5:9,10-diseco-3-hydroxy-5,9,17-trioxoandrosta-1(10),2-diene-4-oate hydrolase
MPQARGQRERIIAACYEVATILKEAWSGFARRDADLRALALELDVPIWFAWAAQDRIIALRQNLPAIRQVKRASATTFRGGHAPFLEQPEAFAQGFIAFCERHGMTALQEES